MVTNTKLNKTDIISSSEIDDLIFTSIPSKLTLDEEREIRDRLIRSSFNYHFHNNKHYRKYCSSQNISENIKSIDDIPVFPTSVFKNFRLFTSEEKYIENWFTSSGTSGTKSYIARDRLSIERLLGSVNYGMKYVGYWFEHQMELINLGPDRSNAGDVWFQYVMSLVELLYPTVFTGNDNKIDFEATIRNLYRIKRLGKTTCLIGPPYFISLLCNYMKKNEINYDGGDSIYIITGGGWKKNEKDSLERSDFNNLLVDTFQLNCTSQIRDTFNQVELNTCFFEDEYQRKHVPPWVYARALDPRTLQPVANGQEGLMSYIDASSTSYPAFLITDDIGIVREIDDDYPGITIEIVRRVNTLGQKGCALSMSQSLALA
ncbi:long-chain fatty acid--CoA ligase [Candidatus Enterovibrio escicola]|uniref:LuxE, long-chain-fatty-acid ligase n=1 Tax=Candidatus Enterovibrio escicola TaxID=1927127 RepID=A0A2A5T3C0_9GAMM|nr:long-chain fatty acid--CoA ligase [Candidatus Enterovibrio escacola]PCS22641.1 LuxE, long-chain-fatty-acid ligase [Candidatus Enterovibrio escacola]